MGDTGPTPSPEAVAAMKDTAGSVTFLILLRAFASGAVALTGTEAIATGVPAFQPPESPNAARTLMAMAVILAILFIGITFLASSFHILPSHGARRSSPRSPTTSTATRIGFYLFQAFTALLLFLAANTSFAAFPRLAAVLAEDGFFPRQFAFRGDRLAYSTGHPAAGRRGRARRHRRRRLHPRADPAVRGRRVHRLHDLPVRHGQALDHDQGPGLALPADDQRDRARC